MSATSPVVLFLESGSPAKSLCTKIVDLSTCSWFPNRIAALGFPTRYRAARFNGTKSSSCRSLLRVAQCCTVSARSNLPWAKHDNLMHADVYRLASSQFQNGTLFSHPTQPGLAISRDVISVFLCSS